VNSAWCELVAGHRARPDVVRLAAKSFPAPGSEVRVLAALEIAGGGVNAGKSAERCGGGLMAIIIGRR
jgi:hypothetical protein